MRLSRRNRTGAVLSVLSLLSCTSTLLKPSALNFGGYGGAIKNNETLAKEEKKAIGTEEIPFGVDVSFPMHRAIVSTNYAHLPHNVDPANNPMPEEYEGMPVQPLGNRQKFYDDFMQACREHYGINGKRCDITEADRLKMNLQQPVSMQNYTELGFKKIKAPDAVWRLLQDFWSKNKDNRTPENWSVGNTYTNTWDSPTYMISVEDQHLRGGGDKIKKSIWNAARDTIQEWTNEELTECSLYGIRVYTDGALLAPHVDRLPLVSSAILNVAQDVDEPWPIEVIGHDGRAHNVTMEPGEMILYESHSVIHGRPYPLKGRYYANVFIHFEPTGHSLRHNAEGGGGDMAEKYRRAIAKGIGGHENEADGLPPYILKGTPEEARWRQLHPTNKRSAINSFATGTTEAHVAAQEGDVEALSQIVDKMGHLINAKDENGWTPLHEGARGGHTDVVELLVKKGANVNERTINGRGGSALWYAIEGNGEDHPVVSFLESVGALNIGPEL